MLARTAVVANVSIEADDGADVCLIKDREAAIEIKEYLNPGREVFEAYERACRWAVELPGAVLYAMLSEGCCRWSCPICD